MFEPVRRLVAIANKMIHQIARPIGRTISAGDELARDLLGLNSERNDRLRVLRVLAEEDRLLISEVVERTDLGEDTAMAAIAELKSERLIAQIRVIADGTHCLKLTREGRALMGLGTNPPSGSPTPSSQPPSLT